MTFSCQHSNFQEHAFSILKENHYKLTKARKEVIKIFNDYNFAINAYKLQDLLNNQFSAITVYRVIETLEKVNLIHKVHSLNAYIPCRADHKHKHVMLICRNCNQVSLMPSDNQTIKKIYKFLEKEDFLSGFELDDVILELNGKCKNCQK